MNKQKLRLFKNEVLVREMASFNGLNYINCLLKAHIAGNSNKKIFLCASLFVCFWPIIKLIIHQIFYVGSMSNFVIQNIWQGFIIINISLSLSVSKNVLLEIKCEDLYNKNHTFPHIRQLNPSHKPWHQNNVFKYLHLFTYSLYLNLT